MSYYAVHRVANKLLNTFEIWNIQFSENKDSNGRALMHIFTRVVLPIKGGRYATRLASNLSYYLEIRNIEFSENMV